VVEHVMAADGCDGDAARQQVRSALYDGALNPLKWEDTQPSPRNVGGITVPLDDPQLMPDGEIDWDAGTLIDVSEYSPPPGRHRRLLILWLRVREHWPEKEAEASSGSVADISAARRKRGRPPVEREATRGEDEGRPSTSCSDPRRITRYGRGSPCCAIQREPRNGRCGSQDRPVGKMTEIHTSDFLTNNDIFRRGFKSATDSQIIQQLTLHRQ
jgi:hypothetical protein